VDDRAISLTDWSDIWNTLLSTIEQKTNKLVQSQNTHVRKAVTVLVSAAGSTNGVNVIQALRSQQEYQTRIIAIDSSPHAAGLHLADEYEIAPRVSEPSFRDFISNICRQFGVSILMPTHSVELPFYSYNQKLFQDIGVKLAISSLDKLRICDDKRAIAEFFHKQGATHPRIYDSADIPESEYPLLIKSRFGSGSAYVRKIESKDELAFFMNRTPDPVVQQYVEGTEYTVNIVSDFDGKVVGLVPLRRVVVKGGLAVVAQVEMDPALICESKRIVELLGLIGPSNVQVIKRDEELVFLEVNPRFASGGMPLAASAGLNIPLLMMKLMLGDPIGEISIQDGREMIRYLDYIVI